MAKNPCIELHAPHLKDRFNELVKSGMSEIEAGRKAAMEDFAKLTKELNAFKESIGIKLTKDQKAGYKEPDNSAKVKEITDAYAEKIKETQPKPESKTEEKNTTQETPQRTLNKTDTKTLKVGDIIDWNGADMEVTKVNSNGSVDAVNARYTPGNRKINGIVNSDSEYGGKVSKEYSDKGKEQFQAEDNKKPKEQNTNDRIEKVKAALKTLFPDLKIVSHETSKAFDDQVSEKSGRKGKSVAMYKETVKDGKTTREIHLNLEKLNSTSIYHEGTHPVLDLLESIDPGLTNRLHDQLLELEKALGVEGQFTKEFAKRYKTEDKKTEAIVEFIAHIADGRIDLNKRSVLEKIKSFFVELFKGLGINIRPKLRSIDDLRSIASKISEAFREGSTLIVDQNVINGKTETGLRTQFEIDNEQNDALKDVESTTKALNNLDENTPNKRNLIINDNPQEIYTLSIGENPEDLSYMGKGDFGEAYETKNGTVIKITSSPNEAEIAKSLIGKKGNYAEIYDVKKVGNKFIIHQEMLETDSDIEDKLQRVQNILEEQDLPIQYLGSIDYDELSSESKQEYDDLSKFISDLEDVNRIYRNLGIEASDIQDGNLGYDKNGKLKAFDLQDKNNKTKASEVEADPIKSKNEVISEAYHNALKTTENKRTEYQNDLIEEVEQILSTTRTQFELEADKKQETLDFIKDYFKNEKFTKNDIEDFYKLHKNRFVKSGISTSEIATYLEEGKIPDAITSNDFGTKEQPKASKEKLIINDILNIDSTDYEKELINDEALHNNNERLEEDLGGEKNKYIVTTHNLMLASMDQPMAIIYDEAQKSGEDFYDKAFNIFRQLQATKSINAAIFGIRLSELIKTELNKSGLSPAKAEQLKSINKDTTRLLQKGGKEIARVLSLYRRIKTKSDSARVLILQNNDAVKKRIAEMEKELENMKTMNELTEDDPYSVKTQGEATSPPKKKRKPIDALAQAKAKLKGKTNVQKATDTFKELMKKRPC